MADHETSRTRVVIIAPTPALRAGLRALLDAPELRVVGESGVLAGPAADLGAADVLLLADEAPLPELGRLLGGEGRIGVVLLADDERPAASLRTLPLIGWGLVPRDTSPAELQAAVIAVGQGLVVLPPAIAARLLVQRPTEATIDADMEPLTSRELEVLELMGRGLPNKQIARSLQISEHTVKFHISSIFAKLRAASRTDAVGRAARQGLIALLRAGGVLALWWGSASPNPTIKPNSLGRRP
jgi:DNA-binding NarL/FixJ family response regulator